MKKFFSRNTKLQQSIIQPNASININDLSKYAQTIPNKDILGFKGLKRAFNNELEVEIIVSDENDNRQPIKGRISHYDEKYEQLLVVVGSSLKRVVFNQIIEVNIEEAVE
jgi:hypothetical protein